MAQKPNELRIFRSNIATLKRKGLISGVDARSAVPTRKLNQAIAKFEGVLSGKATAVKLDKQGLADYKKLGKAFEVASPKGLPRRVIIPHEAGEKVSVSHGKVKISNKTGIQRTIVPVPYRNLEQYFKQLEKTSPKLKPGEYYAHRFFGNRSIKVYRSIEALLDDLRHYESIFDAMESGDTDTQYEMYQNLEIIRITAPAEWKKAPRKGEIRKSEAKRKRLEQLPEFKRQQQREANRQRQQEYRNRLKKNKTKLKQYNKQGRERAAKSKQKRGKQ
jgi:hypothetical protein